MGQTVRNPEPGPPSTLIVVVGGKGGLVCSCGVTGLGQWGRDVLQLAPVPPAPPPPPSITEDKAVSCAALTVQRHRSVKPVPVLWGAETAM